VGFVPTFFKTKNYYFALNSRNFYGDKKDKRIDHCQEKQQKKSVLKLPDKAGCPIRI